MEELFYEIKFNIYLNIPFFLVLVSIPVNLPGGVWFMVLTYSPSFMNRLYRKCKYTYRTFWIEQICASLKKKIRVHIS